jgi:glycerol kinase
VVVELQPANIWKMTREAQAKKAEKEGIEASSKPANGISELRDFNALAN